MAGFILKRFLEACESRGLLKVFNSSSSLENELEMIWEDVSCSANTVQKLSSLDANSRYTSTCIGVPSIVSLQSPLRFSSASQGIAEDVSEVAGYESVIVGTSSSLHKSEPEFKYLLHDLNEEDCEPEAIISIPGDAEYQIDKIRVKCHTDSALILPEVFDVSTPRKLGREEDFVLPGNPLICSTPAAQNASVEDMSNHSNEAKNLALYIFSESSDKDCAGYSRTKHSNESDYTCNNEAEISAGYSLPTIDQSNSVSNSNPLVTCAATQFVLPHGRHVIEIQESSDSDSDEQLEQLFTNLKIRKEQMREKSISRKSLSVFVVSDSEQIEISDEEKETGHTPLTSSSKTTCCHMPTYNTPTTGLAFCISHDENLFGGQKKAFTCVKKRQPLVERENFFSPLVQSARSVPSHPLTTPSSHKNYPRFKNIMLKELLGVFNRTVFDNKLVDVEVVWSKKLRTTAGFCKYKGLYNARAASIELSTKVLDDFDRLRDTLIHELCHAACWIIDGNKSASHGPVWRAWADKALAHLPRLNPVTRCHNYEISYKYIYQCLRCDFKTGRHSKSLNLITARCPHCEGEMELEPRLKSDGTPFAEKKLTRYAQFVKDNYSTVKVASPTATHFEVMKKINTLYHQVKEKPVKM